MSIGEWSGLVSSTGAVVEGLGADDMCLHMPLLAEPSAFGLGL